MAPETKIGAMGILVTGGTGGMDYASYRDSSMSGNPLAMEKRPRRFSTVEPA